jgi:hypothetical protein
MATPVFGLLAGGSAVGSGVSDSLGLTVSVGGADVAVAAGAEVGAAVVGAAVVGVGVAVRVAGGVVGGFVVGATV